MRKQMVYIDGSTLSLRCCGCFRRALLPESREVARGGSATSRRSFSSNFVPTPRWRRLWAGSEYVGGLETEQGAGRRGCMRPLDAQHGTAGGATEATLRRWGVCDGVWKGVGVWKGCEGRRRGTASPLSLIWVGEAPASAGAEEPRRRIGGGSTASASGGSSRRRTRGRGDAPAEVRGC